MKLHGSSAFLLAALLAGCGGSGSKSDSTSYKFDENATISPRVTIAWPARARDFAAPAYADAARIIFPGAGAYGADASQTVTRPAGSDAVTQTYELEYAVHPGRRLLRVDFVADVNSNVVLATANVNLQVRNDGSLRGSDGKPLGSVSYGTKVTALVVAEGTTAEVGVTADLAVFATGQGGVVALPPSAISFRVTSGGEFLRVNADGTVTGLAVGEAVVVASVDGVVGQARTVAVRPAPIASRSVDVSASDFVVDPSGARLFLAVPASGMDGNAIRSLDAATGVLGAPIALDGEPNVLAISDDGSTLYAGLRDVGTVARIDVASGAVTDRYPVPPTGFGSTAYALDIAVQPGSVTTYALTSAEFQSSGDNGPQIFDAGVKRPNALGSYEGTRPPLDLAQPDRRLRQSGEQRESSRRGGGRQRRDHDANRTLGSQHLRLSCPGGRTPLRPERRRARCGVAHPSRRLQTCRKATAEPPVTIEPVVDPSTNRAYFVQANDDVASLLIYDTRTFAPLSTRRIANVSGATIASVGRPALRRLGNRLALRLGDRVVLLDDVTGL